MRATTLKCLVALLVLGAGLSCRRCSRPDTAFHEGTDAGEREQINCMRSLSGGRERWARRDEPTWVTARIPQSWCTPDRSDMFRPLSRVSVCECAAARIVVRVVADVRRISFYDWEGAWVGSQEESRGGADVSMCIGQVPAEIVGCHTVGGVKCSYVDAGLQRPIDVLPDE